MKNKFKRMLAVVFSLGVVLCLMSAGAGATEFDGEVVTGEALVNAANNASSGDTITLGNDITLTSAVVIEGKALTIDMNGHNISFPTLTNGNEVFSVKTGGTLTLNNSKTTGGVVTANEAFIDDIDDTRQ